MSLSLYFPLEWVASYVVGAPLESIHVAFLLLDIIVKNFNVDIILMIFHRHSTKFLNKMIVMFCVFLRHNKPTQWSAYCCSTCLHNRNPHEVGKLAHTCISGISFRTPLFWPNLRFGSEKKYIWLLLSFGNHRFWQQNRSLTRCTNFLKTRLRR